jgi:hypothetical protein
MDPAQVVKALNECRTIDSPAQLRPAFRIPKDALVVTHVQVIEGF